MEDNEITKQSTEKGREMTACDRWAEEKERMTA